MVTSYIGLTFLSSSKQATSVYVTLQWKQADVPLVSLNEMNGRKIVSSQRWYCN